MNWRTKMKTLFGKIDQYQPTINEDGKTEARNALENAKEALRDAQNYKAQAMAVAASVADSRSRNHYGEAIYFAMLPKEKRV